MFYVRTGPCQLKLPTGSQNQQVLTAASYVSNSDPPVGPPTPKMSTNMYSPERIGATTCGAATVHMTQALWRRQQSCGVLTRLHNLCRFIHAFQHGQQRRLRNHRKNHPSIKPETSTTRIVGWSPWSAVVCSRKNVCQTCRKRSKQAENISDIMQVCMLLQGSSRKCICYLRLQYSRFKTFWKVVASPKFGTVTNKVLIIMSCDLLSTFHDSSQQWDCCQTMHQKVWCFFLAETLGPQSLGGYLQSYCRHPHHDTLQILIWKKSQHWFPVKAPVHSNATSFPDNTHTHLCVTVLDSTRRQGLWSCVNEHDASDQENCGEEFTEQVKCWSVNGWPAKWWDTTAVQHAHMSLE